VAGVGGGRFEVVAAQRRSGPIGASNGTRCDPHRKPDDFNVIIGQAHFIKTLEDLHEALAGSSPHLRFGIAFCEASAQRLARQSLR
jgi:hypothetical protein